MESIKDFTKALKINSKFVEAYFGRGASEYEIGQFQNAINDYEIVIKINPDFNAYNNLGLTYSKIGKLQKSLEYFNIAVKLNQSSANSLYNRANTKILLKDFKGAREDLNSSINILIVLPLLS